jgi:general secretion pathway protein G
MALCYHRGVVSATPRDAMQAAYPGAGRAQQPRRARGFTLIELIVAVAILAILATLIVPRLLGRVDDAQVAKARTDVAALATALNLYKLDNYTYPSTDQGLQALVARPTGQPEARNWKAGGYIERLPKDPWGRDYQYLSPGQHGEFDVWSNGRDGRGGGEGPDADLGNWTP